MTSITKYARRSSGNHSQGEGGSKKSCMGSYRRNEVAIPHLDLSKKTSLAYTRFGCTCKKFSAAQTPSLFFKSAKFLTPKQFVKSKHPSKIVRRAAQFLNALNGN